jgi:hypothetical protein
MVEQQPHNGIAPVLSRVAERGPVLVVAAAWIHLASSEEEFDDGRAAVPSCVAERCAAVVAFQVGLNVSGLQGKAGEYCVAVLREV